MRENQNNDRMKFQAKFQPQLDPTGAYVTFSKQRNWAVLNPHLLMTMIHPLGTGTPKRSQISTSVDKGLQQPKDGALK